MTAMLSDVPQKPCDQGVESGLVRDVDHGVNHTMPESASPVVVGAPGRAAGDCDGLA